MVETNKMDAMNISIEAINEVIKPLLGHAAWNVNLGIGSFVTMEFGNLIMTTSRKPRGEWHLWIYFCGWYLENPRGLFLGSEDPRKILKQEIKVLESHHLEKVVISPIAFETNFVFDDNLVLHTFPLYFNEPYEYWKLFTPIGKVLFLGPGRSWSFESSAMRKP